MTTFRACVVAALLSFCASQAPTPARAEARDVCAYAAAGAAFTETILVEGRRRSFDIHRPAGMRHALLPVVFAFHGRGETPRKLARYSGLSRLPAIVVYPRGLPGRGGKLSWSGTPTADPRANDIHFIGAILGKLDRSACVDRTRTFAVGKSDGGGFAAQLACEAADRFSAVATIAGAYYPIHHGGCRPTRPVSILEIHGSADRVVPYRGSKRRRLPNVRAWLVAWAERNGCRSGGRARAESAHVSRTRWNRCGDGVVVEGYRVIDGGHTWPGATRPSGPGATTYEIDATATVRAFFHAARRAS